MWQVPARYGDYLATCAESLRHNRSGGCHAVGLVISVQKLPLVWFERDRCGVINCWTTNWAVKDGFFVWHAKISQDFDEYASKGFSRCLTFSGSLTSLSTTLYLRLYAPFVSRKRRSKSTIVSPFQCMTRFVFLLLLQRQQYQYFLLLHSATKASTFWTNHYVIYVLGDW